MPWAQFSFIQHRTSTFTTLGSYVLRVCIHWNIWENILQLYNRFVNSIGQNYTVMYSVCSAE